MQKSEVQNFFVIVGIAILAAVVAAAVFFLTALLTEGNRLPIFYKLFNEYGLLGFASTLAPNMYFLNKALKEEFITLHLPRLFWEGMFYGLKVFIASIFIVPVVIVGNPIGAVFGFPIILSEFPLFIPAIILSGTLSISLIYAYKVHACGEKP